MTPSPQTVQLWMRLRGAILELVDEGHKEQRARMNDLVLWGVLQKLQYDVSQNDVLAILQDLGERGYLQFSQEKNWRTHEVRISKIQITPKGRDLLEGTIIDAAVNVLR
jgi:hypothetical protein